MAAQPESIWHDPAFDAARMRHWRPKNLRKARERAEENEPYVCEEREHDEQITRRHDRENPKPSGNPDRAIPRFFDDAGELPSWLVRAIPESQNVQAKLLFHAGMIGKGNRQALCGAVARRIDCVEHDEHRYFRKFQCQNRYCPACGPVCFRELFARHVDLRGCVERLRAGEKSIGWRKVESGGKCKRERIWQASLTGTVRTCVLAKLDITTKKLGRMPTKDEVRRFNEDIRRFFRAVESEFGISRGEYGALWCCEFGRMNENLHAHGIYCGPWLKQKKLSRLWRETRADGSFIVSIKIAKSFEQALAHCLKYPSKFFDAPAERLASLEKAFHRVRRVHAVACFYNFHEEREPGEDTGSDTGLCPECKGMLGEPYSKEDRGWSLT